MSLARPGHCVDTGRGHPTPSMVPSVRHAGAMAVSEQDSLAHREMQEGGRAKETEPGSGGGEGGNIQGFQ